jgi:hypothetical protein
MGGGWNEYTYAVVLVFGFLIAADRRFGQAMGRGWPIALAAGLAAEVIYVVGLYLLLEVDGLDPLHDYDLGSVLWRVAKGMGAWFWVVAILGFGSRPRPDPVSTDFGSSVGSSEIPRQSSLGTRLIAYAGEAFLAVYILHQTVVFVLGYYVVQAQTAALLKYMAISLTALVVTLLLYEFAVRRAPVTRWLFGMKPQHAGKKV